MTTTQLRKRLKEQIENLSPRGLKVAANVVDYIEQQETNPATDELLSIPGFTAAFERGMKEVRDGKMTPVEKLKRKYRHV